MHSPAARNAVIAALALLGVACAHTRVSSLAAPDAVGVRFRRIMVSVQINDLEIRRAAEDQFAKSYQGTSVTFVPSYQVLFPGTS